MSIVPFPPRHDGQGRPFERFVTKQQVAAHLGVSTRWVEKRSNDAGLPWPPRLPRDVRTPRDTS